MVKVAEYKGVIIHECGYKPPRVKSPELWYNIYLKTDVPYQKTLPFKTHWSLASAFNHMMNLVQDDQQLQVAEQQVDN